LSKQLTFIVPGDPGQRTGGYLFDARIVSELRTGGWQVRQIGLEGRFPMPDKLAEQSMSAALADQDDDALVVIDGLALGGLGEAVALHAQRLRVIGLIHHPLADETGLPPDQRQHFLASEAEALAHCRKIIVTSSFTADRLRKLALSQRPAIVIEPGVDRAQTAPIAAARANSGIEPDHEHLLCVASLTPRKGQDLLLAALEELDGSTWRCRLSGSDQRDRMFALELRQAVQKSQLEHQIEITGERNPEQLASDYQWASVLVLPSHYEGYGMVVTEALSRGLPLIATTGGALIDTVPPEVSLRIPPGDRIALAEALKRWLGEPELRQRLTRAAMDYRQRLPCWRQAGQRFAESLSSTPALAQ
jgi:glycosyltransferase involved in cell wall biosynthesis